MQAGRMRFEIALLDQLVYAKNTKNVENTIDEIKF